VVFLVLDLAKLRSEVCNILVLKRLGPIEYDKVMIVTSNPVTKLGFDFGIMP